MSEIFFSIIITTYNEKKYIKECIESCLLQRYQNFEIIVVDNYSDDGTDEILKSYKDKIILEKINNKEIISKSRNLALKKAKGDWVVLLDADDFFTKNKLSELVLNIEKSNFDVFCNSEIILDSTNRKRIWFNGNKSKNLYLDLIKYGNCLSTSASAVKKSFLEKNNIFFSEERKIRNIADYDFFLNIAKAGGKFYFLNTPLGFHRIRQDSLTGKNTDFVQGASKKILFNHFRNNSFNKKILIFAIINVKLSNLLLNKKETASKKIFTILKRFILNPVVTFLSVIRIIKRILKHFSLNLIYSRKIKNL